MTQPDVYIGFTPTLGAGHGNHQQAGRFIWEGMLGRGRPDDVPGPADRAARAQHVAGQEGLLRRQHRRHRRHDDRRRLHDRLHPDAGHEPRHRRGRVDGLRLAVPLAGRQRPGQAGGHAEDLGAGRVRGQLAPTRRRAATMYMGTQPPGCSRFGQTDAFVPFQPNTNPDGTANPLAGKDDAILYGAVDAGSGRAAARHARVPDVLRFYNVAGHAVPGDAAPASPAGRRSPAGTVALTVPAGWTVDAAEADRRRSRERRESTATFTVTPPRDAAVNTNFKVSALLHERRGRPATRTTSCASSRRSRAASSAGASGPSTTAGSTNTGAAGAAGSAARPRSRRWASARRSRCPVDVHNWSTTTQSGTVTLTLPAGFTRRRDVEAVRAARARRGHDGQLHAHEHGHDAARRRDQRPGHDDAAEDDRRSRTSYSTPAASASEDLTLAVVPEDDDPGGRRGAGRWTARRAPASTPARRSTSAASGTGRRDCAPAGVDCGTSGAPSATPTSTLRARSRGHGDDLYFFVHVRDDFQSYAVTPSECVAHWLADSVEILIDPRGNALAELLDTANTFKLGVFPFTNDPTNFNGNGVNGPCWERDADNHQGYSTGPLAATVDARPERARRAGRRRRRRGSARNDDDRRPQLRRGRRLQPRGQDPDGRPPAAADRPGDNDAGPEHHAVRRGQHGRGGHDDAAPHRPEHAPRVVDVRQRPVRSVPLGPRVRCRATRRRRAGRRRRRRRTCRTRTSTASTRRRRSTSRRTNGVPISGRDPAPGERQDHEHRRRRSTPSAATFDITADRAGHRPHLPLGGRPRAAIPVFISTSCALADRPARRTTGFSACAHDRRRHPAVVAGHERPRGPRRDVTVDARARTHVSIPLDAARVREAGGRRARR